MRVSRLVAAGVALVFCMMALPVCASGFTLYGASGETTANAYGNYYAGEAKCAGALCHKNIVEQETVHGDFVTDVKAKPSALVPAAGDSAFWPTPFSGIKLNSSDIYLKLGDDFGPIEYAGSADTTLGTPNPSDDLRLWSGLSYTAGGSAWDPSAGISASAYSQSCSGCHNLGVTRPANATYMLPNSATQTTKTPSGAWGLGIQCEVCHGSGKSPGAHAPGVPAVVGGTQVLKAQVCGQCHETGTTAQKNVTGGAFSSPDGYTADATLSACITPTLAVPTEAQFMSYITSGGAKPAFLPNGDDYSLRHDYYNEWLDNLVPSSHGGAYGHADPTNASVVAQGDSKCLGCHSGLGFLQRIGSTTPLGSLVVTEPPTLAEVQADDPGISCQVCHDGHVGYNADKTGSDSARTWGDGTPVECGDCHNWQFEVMGQALQTEVIGGKRYARPPANTAVRHPQRELFTGGEGGTVGTAGLWGVAPMGEFMPGTTCQDCHMPRTAREGMPANDDGSTESTRMSHRFHVTEPGDAARWKLRTGGDSCTVAGCHTESAADYTRADFQQWIDSVQSGTQRNIDEATSALSAVSASLGMAGRFSDFEAAQPGAVTAPTPAEWEMLQKAAQNVDFVNQDSSLGVHQPQYSAEGLNVAIMWARSYDASIAASKQPRIDGGDGARIVGTLLGNDGKALAGATVVLEASTDSGQTWTTAQTKHMTSAVFNFDTGAVLGETLFRCSYSPDAGVVYRTGTMALSVPVTIATLTPSTAATGWVAAPVQVALSTTANGAITFYSLSGATTQGTTVYAGPFSIATNGETDVTFWSTTAEGAEIAHTQAVRIDRTTPAIASDAASLYADSASIHLTASDSFSGPQCVEYSLDGAAWVRVSGDRATVGVTSLGSHGLRARATNNLGHTSAEKAWSFSVKRTLSISVSPKSSTVRVKRNRRWAYSAVLRTRTGAALSGRPVKLQKWSGGAWRAVATYRTSRTGTVSRRAKMTARGTSRWRWYMPADGSHLAAVGRTTKLVVK